MDDPYAILLLRRESCTMADLRSNYTKLASQVHPSNPSCTVSRDAANDILKTLSECYQAVLMDLRERRRRQIDPSSSTDDTTDERRRAAAREFDMEKFNRVFASQRTPDVYDIGHGDWLHQAAYSLGDDVIGVDENVPKACDEYEDEHACEPRPMLLSSMGFSELGADAVDDFGTAATGDKVGIGFGVGGKGAVCCTDLREALSSRSNAINSRLDQRSRDMLRNAPGTVPASAVDQVIAQRSSAASLELSDRQKQALERRRLAAEDAERRRKANAKASLRQAAKRFERAQKVMFGERSS